VGRLKYEAACTACSGCRSPSRKAESTPRRWGRRAARSRGRRGRDRPEHLRIDVFRSSGPGGQSVNTTTRLCESPRADRTVVSMQNEKSQLQTEPACGCCARGCWQRAGRGAAQASDARRSQVRTVDDPNASARTTCREPHQRPPHRFSLQPRPGLDAPLDDVTDALMRATCRRSSTRHEIARHRRRAGARCAGSNGETDAHCCRHLLDVPRSVLGRCRRRRRRDRGPVSRAIARRGPRTAAVHHRRGAIPVRLLAWGRVCSSAPETELLVDAVLADAAQCPTPIAVDLCADPGACRRDCPRVPPLESSRERPRP